MIEKRNINRFTTLIAAFWLLVLGATGLRAEVYEWTGGSGLWNDLSHWQVDGANAMTLPGADDHVWIEANSALSIEIQEALHIGSIVVSGSEDVVFNASSKTKIQIEGSLLLSENSTISKKLNFEMLGQASQNFKQYTNAAASQISESSGNYSELQAAAVGSCASFTIVENPSPPTCNGFDDGVAEVLEPVDGVGPYTYQWIGGPNTSVWPNVNAGTYTVIVIDLGQGGIPCNADVFVNEPGPLTVFDMNATPPLCADVCNGTSTPIVIGGNGGFTYDWSSGESGISANMLCTVFTLHVEDVLGCVFDTTYTYPNPPDTIKFTPVIVGVDCFGNDNGSIDMTISGGAPPFVVSWSGPSGFVSNNEDISALEPGFYTISVEDDNNCLASEVFEIEENVLLEATATTVDNECGGGELGEINLSPAGGFPPYTFAWTGPDGFVSTDEDLTALEAGTYDVTITDNVLCTFDFQVIIDEPVSMLITYSQVNILCFGDFTGEVSATAQNGTPGYTFNWTGPNGFADTGADLTGLESGMYYLEVVDANTCAIIDSIEITQPDLLEIDLLPTPITCSVGNDGIIDLNITGGTTAYNVSWTGPNGYTSADQNISNLAAGIYSVTVTDANSCEATGSLELISPDPMTLSADIFEGTCLVGSTGDIDLTIGGGAAPLDIVWSGPSGFSSTNEDISSLQPGTYTVVVTDDNSCLVTQDFEVGPPPSLIADFDITHVLCFGQNTGEIITTPTEGVGPYNFIWIGPNGFISTDQNISNLYAGNYELAMFDAGGCNTITAVTINQETEIVIDEDITDVQCFDGNNGSITLQVSGGNPPYDFSWTGPDAFTSTDQDLVGVESGDYNLELTDAFGCIIPASYQILEPLELTVTETITEPLCADDNDGSIELDLLGGNPGFTFSWTGPNGFTSSDEDIFGIEGGDYDLTIEDAAGCQFLFSYNLASAIVLNGVADITDVSCFGSDDGSIVLTMSGGAEPYDITWTGPNAFASTDTDLFDLEAGDYTVTVQDGNGCPFTATYTVATPDELLVTLDGENISCHDANDGMITAFPSGGTSPYNVLWTGPNGFTASTATILDLEAGMYIVVITDGANCTITDSLEIINPLELILDVNITQPDCAIDNGELTAVVSGGTIAMDYTISWMDEFGGEISTLATISNLAPGDYSVVVTDDNNCSLSQSVELTRDLFTISENITHITCNGEDDGKIEIVLSGGTPNFTFAWTGPNGFTSSDEDISELEPGIYNLEVEDQAGCLTNGSFEIINPSPIVFDFDIIPIACAGDGNGRIELTLSGGSPGYFVSWNGVNGFIGNGLSISDLEPGIYTATVSDISGCITFEDVELLPGNEFDITGVEVSPLCAGDETGSIDITVNQLTGVATTYTYAWIGPNGFTSADEDIALLASGIYDLTVTDAQGCSVSSSFELIEPIPMTLSTSFTNATCLAADGTASAVGGGGTGTLTYSWLNDLGVEITSDPDINGLAAGAYTIILTDDAGCSLTETVDISDSSITVDEDLDHPTCNQDSDGTIDITIMDAAAPYTVQWTLGGVDFSTDENLANLSAGIYAIEIVDANGCTFNASYELIDPLEITASSLVTGVSCVGDDGSIALTIQNAVSGSIVNWTGPNGYTGFGATISGLETGDYDFVIQDVNLCSLSGTIEVPMMPALDIVATPSDIQCGGDANGEILLDVSGGSTPYFYEWIGPDGFTSDQEDIFGLEGGFYDLVLSDANNCSLIVQYEIVEPAPLQVVFDVVSPDCNQTNGSISTTITGGVVSGDYFIGWSVSNGDAIPADLNISNLDIGTYHLFVSDDNGCFLDTSVVLSNAGANITPSIIHLTCFTETEGSIQLDVQDVQAPYDVAWTGPNGFVSTDENIFSLEAGFYTYQITGADGCMFTEQLEVQSPEQISVAAGISMACFGEESGAISIEVLGGLAPYTIGWTGPNGFVSTNTELTELLAGDYDLQVLDANTCLHLETFTVNENPELFLTSIKTDVMCNGGNTGEIDAEASGGMGALSVSWTGPDGFVSADLDLVGLEAGAYVLVITDEAFCTITDTIDILEPDTILVDATVVSVGCGGVGSLGSIDVDIQGGVPAYTIAWTGPNGFVSTDELITDLEPGIYTYTVTDASLCVVSDDIEILDALPIEITADMVAVTCNGETDGSLIAAISGGTEPYTLSWTGSDGFISDQTEIEDLTPGIYALQVDDAGGCSATESFEILEPDAIDITAADLMDASCNTLEDGAIAVDIAGGTAPFTFEWTGPNGYTSDLEDIADLAIGNYTLVVTDAHDCAAQIDLVIDTPFEVFADAGEDVAFCASALPQEIVGSGQNTSEYFWTTLDGDTIGTDAAFAINEMPGEYSYILLAGNGLCSNADTIDVAVLNNPEVDAGADFETFAEDVFVLGGNPVSPTGATYAWSPNPTASLDTALANPSGYIVETTEFVVLVTDNNGCQNTDTVIAFLTPDIQISSGITPNGDGVNDTWIIDNMQLFPNNVVNIFDRWGIVVFETTGYNATNAWDGKYEGDDLPVGTYYYTIELNDERFPNPFTGPITIYR